MANGLTGEKAGIHAITHGPLGGEWQDAIPLCIFTNVTEHKNPPGRPPREGERRWLGDGTQRLLR